MKYELIRLNKIFDQIINVAQVGLCYIDSSLRYAQVNDWLAEMNGLTVEQHIGRSIRDLFPDLAAGIEQQFQSVIDTGEPIIGGRVYAETKSRPGVTRLFEHNYYADKAPDGTVIGVICFVEDITESTWVEESPRESEVLCVAQ